MINFQALWGSPLLRRWRNIARILVIVASFGLMIYALHSSVSSLDLSSLRPDFFSLVAAIFLTYSAVWLGALAWGWMVHTVFPNISIISAVYQHLYSLSTKYIPGWGWQQVSKAAQLRQQGIPVLDSGILSFVDLGMVTSSGIATALLIACSNPGAISEFGVSYDVRQLFLVAALLIYLSAPLVIAHLKPSLLEALHKHRNWLLQLYGIELVQSAGWIMFGIGFWFTCNSVVPIQWAAMSTFIIALIASVVAGIIIIFVPNGIGVREVIMSVMILPIIPPPMSITLAFMSRIILVFSEFLGFLSIFVIKISRRFY